MGELERVFRNSINVIPDTLREAHPGLTKGDIRIYMLSHFPVSEQAILLGISPSSVTKARQRLKAKLKAD